MEPANDLNILIKWVLKALKYLAAIDEENENLQSQIKIIKLCQKETHQ